MFPRRNRLTRSRDIIAVTRSRAAYHGKTMTLKWRASTFGQRFTVVVSTKVSKRATERNRIKRQIRAMLWEHRTEFPDNTDLVILLRPRTPLAARPDLAADLQAGLRAMHR